jgi:hypothetical protein
MASFTLGPDQRFPPGTILHVYPAGPGSRPVGPAVASATVAADSTTTVTDLDEEARYVAGTSPAGPFTTFITPTPATGTSNSRVLLWNTATQLYEPTSWRLDTTQPREFVGPTDPESDASVNGPVFGDRWTPTQEPTA